MTDIELIGIAKEGNPAALEQLFMRHAARVFHLALRYVCFREDAEDVVQETFIKVHDGIRSFDTDYSAGFPAWINRICIHCAIDYLRAGKRRGRRMTSLDALLLDPPSSCPTPEQLAVQRDISVQVENAVVCLPPRQRSIFSLRYREHLKISQIAGRLDCSESNIRAQLFKTKSRLRRMFAATA
ncbi:MAG: sigma-70 family RNA polymerase sigma factor [Candidatus Aminicenantes bacterium]|nr:sigma-70 family RNA polymerase sigma factor [Candidatus Aminicenantes bacterium]